MIMEQVSNLQTFVRKRLKRGPLRKILEKFLEVYQTIMKLTIAYFVLI